MRTSEVSTWVCIDEMVTTAADDSERVNGLMQSIIPKTLPGDLRVGKGIFKVVRSFYVLQGTLWNHS